MDSTHVFHMHIINSVGRVDQLERLLGLNLLEFKFLSAWVQSKTFICFNFIIFCYLDIQKSHHKILNYEETLSIKIIHKSTSY